MFVGTAFLLIFPDRLAAASQEIKLYSSCESVSYDMIACCGRPRRRKTTEIVIGAILFPGFLTRNDVTKTLFEF